MESEIRELKAKTVKLKESYTTSKIKLEQTYEGLKKEFGIESEEKARSQMLKLSDEVEKLKVKRDKLLTRTRLKLEKYSASKGA